MAKNISCWPGYFLGRDTVIFVTVFGEALGAQCAKQMAQSYRPAGANNDKQYSKLLQKADRVGGNRAFSSRNAAASLPKAWPGMDVRLPKAPFLTATLARPVQIEAPADVVLGHFFQKKWLSCIP